MKMEWINKGSIFNPLNFDLPLGCKEYAQSPQALVFDNFIRIYFSTRSKNEATGNFLSQIAFVDFDLKMETILQVSEKPVIPLGELGTFDEHGIFPFSPIKIDDKIKAYTCGWSRRVSVSVETSTGLVISSDKGETFERQGNGPVLTSSLLEPALVGDSFVKKYNNEYHMWYMFGKKWIEETDVEPPARVYKIGYAKSQDGVVWKKNEGIEIIKSILGDHECQALPTVAYFNNMYHMFFCFRQPTDFRKNPKRGYKLGYAYSNDLKTWTRDDENSGFKCSGDNWDSQMQAYPNVFQVGDKVYLLYNGNQFGRYGFGLSELKLNN